jgi:chromosome partitioning protein
MPVAPRTNGALTPRVLRAPKRPDLLPSHPDFAVNQPAPETLAGKLNQWAEDWGRAYVVVDTHPGAIDSTFGALSAASLVVVPVVLRIREIDALENMLEEFHEYPLLIVPNLVPSVVPSRMIDRLAAVARNAGAPIAPPVSEYRWWGRRTLRAALTSYNPVPARFARAVQELHAVADTIRAYTHG